MAEVEEDANTYFKQKCQAFSFRTFRIEYPREYKRINQSNFQLNTRQPSSREKKKKKSQATTKTDNCRDKISIDLDFLELE